VPIYQKKPEVHFTHPKYKKFKGEENVTQTVQNFLDALDCIRASNSLWRRRNTGPHRTHGGACRNATSRPGSFL
jgi:hypothetical protein